MAKTPKVEVHIRRINHYYEWWVTVGRTELRCPNTYRSRDAAKAAATRAIANITNWCNSL